MTDEERKERRREARRKWRESDKGVAWRAANAEKHAADLKAWVQNNRDRVRTTDRARHARDRDKRLALNKKWRAENLTYHNQYKYEWAKCNPESRLKASSKWRAQNKGTIRAAARLRRGVKNFGYTNMTEFERLEVEAMYQFCSAFPWFEVDHIVPLKAKNHSGLHVRNNLQVLDKTLNRKKSNKVCPAYVTIMEGILPTIQNYGR